MITITCKKFSLFDASERGIKGTRRLFTSLISPPQHLPPLPLHSRPWRAPAPASHAPAPVRIPVPARARALAPAPAVPAAIVPARRGRVTTHPMTATATPRRIAAEVPLRVATVNRRQVVVGVPHPQDVTRHLLGDAISTGIL
jgi:hypothetical protein